MIKYILVILVNLSCLKIYGQQVILQPPLITAFECTEFAKLYTCTIQNFSDETYEAIATIAITYTSPDGNTSRLAEGTLSGSPSITIMPGTMNISLANYQSTFTSRNINFQNADVERLLSKSNCLPPEQYDVCLTFYSIDEITFGDNFIAQTCYEFEKEMLTSLFLVSPFENEELTLDLPLFTWTAVLPFNPQANYRIQIVELLANQTPFEAFRSNPIFFEQSGLMSNIFQYPIAARPMLSCTRYAWRVSYELENGFNNPSFLKSPSFFQQSEIWEYSKPCENEEENEDEEDIFEDLEPKAFYKPSLNAASTYHNHYGNIFRFELDNPYEEMNEIALKIIDENGEIQTIFCCVYIKGDVDYDGARINKPKIIYHGKNHLAIDLNNYGLTTGNNYRLLFTDFKQDLYINFKYQDDEK